MGPKLNVRQAASFLAIPQGLPRRVREDGRKEVVQPDEVTREEIGRLAAWGATYPTDVMLGDAKRAADLCNLAARHRARVFVQAGLPRHSSPARPRRDGGMVWRRIEPLTHLDSARPPPM